MMEPVNTLESSKETLSGKKAIITGSGQGLGRTFSLALAKAGADIAVIDINLDNAKKTAEEISQLGRDCLVLEADVSKYNDIITMVDKILSEWGRIDIAVNNAGTAQFKDAIDITEKDWDSVLDLNLKGTFFCCQAEAKAMIPNNYGKIINIASICGHIIWPQFQSSYNASKAALIHLTRSLAVEWIKYGIRVNSISPGVTLTPGLTPKVISIFTAKAPIAKTLSASDIEEAVLFLASSGSDYIVGQDIVIDGGYTLL